MEAGTLKLRSEQLIRNRLWRHSVLIPPDAGAGEIAGVLETLLAGLKESADSPLHPYIVLPADAVDLPYLRAVERGECPRYPVMGDFRSVADGEERNAPFVFRPAEHRLIERFVSGFWGNDRFALFLSPLEPLPFFRVLARFPLVRRKGGALIWSPFWERHTFERRICESTASEGAGIFRWIRYYVGEGGKGRTIRIYSAGTD